MRPTRQGPNECVPASICALFDLDWAGEIRPKVEAILGTTWKKATRDSAMKAFLRVSGVPEWTATAGTIKWSELPGRGRLPKRFPIPKGRGLVCIRHAARSYYHLAGSSVRMDRTEAIDYYRSHPDDRSRMQYCYEGSAAHVMAFENGKLYDPDSPAWELDQDAATAEYGSWRVVKIVRDDGTVVLFGDAARGI